MDYKLLGKINKEGFPLVAKKLSFTAFLFTDVFLFGNKIWFLGVVYVILLFMGDILKKSEWDIFSWTGSVLLMVVFFVKIDLLLKGRIYAWESLKLKSGNKADIEYFKKRQLKILIIALILYSILFVLLYYN